MNLFGLGPFFWSLVLGTTVSLLIERDGWERLRAQVAEHDVPEGRSWSPES